jgi:Zn-dependent protease with chaperone function
MDFFEHQANARRKTGWLIAWFALAVISIIILVYALLSFFLLDGKWDPDAFGLVSCGVTLIVLGGSWFKTLELGRGGSIVAQSLGGHKVSSVTKDPGERRLLNVVEEMALASGVPVPEVYILGEEGGINAFAAGLSVNNAVIGVTRGCVEKLSRDELQGVIAHEFSHILNGDMRMNLNLMGWIYGILCLSIIGRILMRMRSGSRREKNNVLPLVGLGLFMIGHVGVIFARLIKSAVSRQREFLADASAVQFTRNPGGIAGALKKIGSTIGGSRLVSEAAEESSHLLFGNGLSESWIGLFSTHPPLDERIRRIDSSFRGKMSYDRPVGAAGSVSMDSLSSLSPQVSANTAAGISEEKALGDVGSLSEAHLDYAHELHENIPAALMEAARTSPGACSLVYSLLLSSDATAQSSQLGVIPKEFRGETLRLRNLIHDLDERVRMALINLSLDGLRSMSEGQYSEFQKVIFGMITSDDRVDLFEYCLHKIITEHLNAYFRKDEFIP